MRHPKSVKIRHEPRKNDLSTIYLNEGKRAHANHKKEYGYQRENPLGYIKSKTLKIRKEDCSISLLLRSISVTFQIRD